MAERTRLSRRGALVVVGVGSLALSCGRADPAPPVLYDAFANVRDGPLTGRRSDSGHEWIAVGAPGDDPPAVLDGAIGPPAGHVPGRSTRPGDANPMAAAGYAMLDTGGATGVVGADVRWDRSTSMTSALAMGAFTPPPVPRVERGQRRASSMHLVLGPTGLIFTAFARGSDIDAVAPVAAGRPRGMVRFERPMRCDGTTTYRVEIVLDRSDGSAKVLVDGEEPLSFEHPFVSSVPASLAFWEYYTARGGTNLPRFTRVWASPA